MERAPAAFDVRVDAERLRANRLPVGAGIAGAHGQVGPPLDHWSKRVYIAGEVPNTEDFLIRWIEVPEAIEPKTAMPMLGVTEGSARDIAAYLYSIR